MLLLTCSAELHAGFYSAVGRTGYSARIPSLAVLP